MEWYLAKLVYRFQPVTEKGAVHFEEQIRLLEAEDELHAFHKAQLIGSQEECHLKDDNDGIHWHFIDVIQILRLHQQMDGAEVLSQPYKTLDPEGYQKKIRLKAAYLLSDCTDQFLQSR